MNSKLFKKDFTMVVIGQIISLFGNNILRYALPLYLLNETHSASLYGLVLALSFIPMLILAPVGGIIADRVNKRNVMVALDFFTGALMIFYLFAYKKLSLAVLLVVVLMLLYGIQGAYQPTVQASVPILTDDDKLIAGNAVINMVNSLAQFIGPVLGGLIFGFYGLNPILIISICCFIASAVMEIFITIPFEKQEYVGSVLSIVKYDTKESVNYIKNERPEIFNVGIIITIINMIFSALIIIGLPIIVNTKLGFTQSVGNRLYGYAEGALAAGGLVGGLISGIVSKKIKVTKSSLTIFLCTLTLLPIGLVLFFNVPAIWAYLIIIASCFVMMIISTAFSIQMITYVQKITPSNLIGKIMALLSCLVMCGNPVGQLIYGALFDKLNNNCCFIYFGAFLICILLCIISNLVFKKLNNSILAVPTE